MVFLSLSLLAYLSSFIFIAETVLPIPDAPGHSEVLGWRLRPRALSEGRSVSCASHSLPYPQSPPLFSIFVGFSSSFASLRCVGWSVGSDRGRTTHIQGGYFWEGG